MSQPETLRNDAVMFTAEDTVAPENSACYPCCANTPPNVSSGVYSCPKRQKPRRASSQVEPRNYPDCRASHQHRYAVKGALYSPEFNCEWGSCEFRLCRAGCDNGEIYHRLVYAHLESHATNPPAAAAEANYCCQWRGCPGEPEKKPQHKRNRVRHLTSHLPWHVLCLQCASLLARLDVNGSKECAGGTCQAKDERIRKGLETAKATFGPDVDVVLSEFIAVVMGLEKAQ